MTLSYGVTISCFIELHPMSKYGPGDSFCGLLAMTRGAGWSSHLRHSIDILYGAGVSLQINLNTIHVSDTCTMSPTGSSQTVQP